MLTDDDVRLLKSTFDAMAAAGVVMVSRAELDALRAVAEAARTKVAAEIAVDNSETYETEAAAEEALRKADAELVGALMALDRAREAGR